VGNPCRMRRLDKEPTSERPTASVDQVWRLAALMPPQLPALVIFAAFTGLRWGELVALRVRVLILTPQWCTSCESSLNCGTANGFRTGRSQIPGSHLPVEDGSATFEDYAHVLLASYPVDLQDPVLVGHSLGAMVLPLVAATKPASCWHFCAECFQTSRVGLGRALRRWNGSAHTGQRC
jgi:hypothetical protein